MENEAEERGDPTGKGESEAGGGAGDDGFIGSFYWVLPSFPRLEEIFTNFFTDFFYGFHCVDHMQWVLSCFAGYQKVLPSPTWVLFISCYR